MKIKSEKDKKIKSREIGTSLVVQWVRLGAPNAGHPGLIPGQGTRSRMHDTAKSPHATAKKYACRN